MWKVGWLPQKMVQGASLLPPCPGMVILCSAQLTNCNTSGIGPVGAKVAVTWNVLIVARMYVHGLYSKLTNGPFALCGHNQVSI
jgi:hypothetical protein